MRQHNYRLLTPELRLQALDSIQKRLDEAKTLGELKETVRELLAVVRYETELNHYEI